MHRHRSRDQRVAGELDLARLVRGRDRHPDQPLAVALELFGDAAGADDALADVRHRGEAHAELAQVPLRRPVGQQAPEPRHRQHAVGEHVGHPGGAGEIDVDVHRVVVAGRPGVERERRPGQRRQRQRRQRVADVDRIVGEASSAASSARARRWSTASRRRLTPVLVGHVGLLDDERQRAALLLQDVADARGEASGGRPRGPARNSGSAARRAARARGRCPARDTRRTDRARPGRGRQRTSAAPAATDARPRARRLRRRYSGRVSPVALANRRRRPASTSAECGGNVRPISVSSIIADIAQCRAVQRDDAGAAEPEIVLQRRSARRRPARRSAVPRSCCVSS